MIKELKDISLYLKANGIQNPQPEAEYIFCHLLNFDRIGLYMEDTPLSLRQRQNLLEVAQRRKEGEPLQYIFGKTEFYGLEFKVKKGVFIPRPETEILVDTVLNTLYPIPYTLYPNILEVCTGSGNIAISLTKTNPHYRIFASDISKKAIELAKENALLNSISNNIEFRCGSLFDAWSNKKKFFSAIVCNPPYIKTDDLSNLPEDVKNEPKRALDGKKDGLYFYKRILEDAADYLTSNGYIFFEVSPLISKKVEKLLSQENFCDIEIIKDYNGLDRVILAHG